MRELYVPARNLVQPDGHSAQTSHVGQGPLSLQQEVSWHLCFSDLRTKDGVQQRILRRHAHYRYALNLNWLQQHPPHLPSMMEFYMVAAVLKG